MLRIYLAGPQVFRPDAVRYGQQLKEACLASGFVGLFPLDNALPDGLSPPQQAQWIYQANLALLRSALLARLARHRDERSLPALIESFAEDPTSAFTLINSL